MDEKSLVGMLFVLRNLCDEVNPPIHSKADEWASSYHAQPIGSRCDMRGWFLNPNVFMFFAALTSRS